MRNKHNRVARFWLHAMRGWGLPGIYVAVALVAMVTEAGSAPRGPSSATETRLGPISLQTDFGGYLDREHGNNQRWFPYRGCSRAPLQRRHYNLPLTVELRTWRGGWARVPGFLLKRGQPTSWGFSDQLRHQLLATRSIRWGLTIYDLHKWRTPRGIGLGSSYSDVIAAYGQPSALRTTRDGRKTSVRQRSCTSYNARSCLAALIQLFALCELQEEGSLYKMRLDTVSTALGADNGERLSPGW